MRRKEPRATQRIYAEDPISLLMAELRYANVPIDRIQRIVYEECNYLATKNQIRYAGRIHYGYVKQYMDKSPYIEKVVNQVVRKWNNTGAKRPRRRISLVL